MPRKKDPEITEYKLKNGQKYFRLKTYLGTDPETGKPVKVTRSKIKSRKEAEQIRNQLKVDGIQKQQNNEKKTFTDVYNSWLNSVQFDVRGSTLNRFKDTWKNQTQPEFGNIYIDQVRPEHIQKYVNDLAEKYITYRSIAGQLHRLIKYAIFKRWITHDPFNLVIMPKKSAKAKRDTSNNFYELDELKEFLQIAKDYSHMKYTYFLTVASLGCRRSEALALTWNKVDFDKNTVLIDQTVTKDKNGKKVIGPVKNGVSHKVPMSQNLKNILLEYQQHCHEINDNCNLLFHQKDGSIYWAQQVDLWIKYLYKFNAKQCIKYNQTHPNNPKEPLRKITPHGLRHTLATLLYEGNSNIRPKDVQYLLGHRSVKTSLQIYTHVTKKQKEDIKSSINNLNF